MKKKICVIAVHPDDETLGCGGTILKHLRNRDEVHCIFVTGGNKSQEVMIEQVSSIYGFSSVHCLGFQELTLQDISLNQLIPSFASLFSKIEPQILYIPNRSDIHSDHKAVFHAVSACTKLFRYPFIEQILMCEVISETDFALGLPEAVFIPNYYVDISDTFQEKLNIMSLYQSEMLPYPMTRNQNAMTSLNRYRGSLINCEYAEAFMSIKTIVR